MRLNACDGCLRRGWLLTRMAGHLDIARAEIEAVLALDDEDLIDALGGKERRALRREHSRLRGRDARERLAAAGIASICRCRSGYPSALRAGESPPAALYIAGRVDLLSTLTSADPVAIVGARRASSYGLEVARSLARGLASAGVCVTSGMALGIDSAAHAGALEAAALETGAGTVAVLAAGPERPYPASKRRLHQQIQRSGAVVSELPPGTEARRWMFPARNRIIAALSRLTVVVEAREGSGALLTAAAAQRLGRQVGAVPGQVTSPLAAGANALIAAGAALVRGPQDVLDLLFGAGVRSAQAESRAPLTGPHRRLLAAIGSGSVTEEALVLAGFGPEQGLAALAQLELAGYVRRGPGGRFVAVP